MQQIFFGAVTTVGVIWVYFFVSLNSSANYETLSSLMRRTGPGDKRSNARRDG